MSPKRYWATGIRIEYTHHHGPAWGGEVAFFDDLMFDRDRVHGLISTYGHLRTRHFVPSTGNDHDALTLVTDTLIREADRLGVEFREPTIRATGDGVDPDYPFPDDWIGLFEDQSDRLGWSRPTYREEMLDRRRLRLRVLDGDIDPEH